MTLTLVEQRTSAARAPGVVATRRVRIAVPSVVILVATSAVVWTGASSLLADHRLGAALAGGWAELAAPLVLALVLALVVCEQRWPAERRPVLARGLVHDACFFVLHLALVIPLMTLLAFGFSRVLDDLVGGSWRSWTGSIPLWALAAATLMAMDAGNWLAHWTEHRVGALWRMHALHHSQEELNVFTSFRAHPLSHFMGFCLATVPVVLVMGARPLTPVLLTIYVCLGTLPHANVPWSYGPLGKVVVSPAYHRIHHSSEGALGVNLGIVLTAWDVMSRRARFPRPGDAPCPTGIAGRPLATEQTARGKAHVAVLINQLLEPFAKS